MANTKITSRVIADNAVTSSAIADGAITASKIASDAIDIVADTSPQLGGNLDVNGNAITGSTVQINGAGGDLMISATENGPVALRYDNNLKLTTKSDGVDITGELQSDSLDVDGDADISGTIALGNLTIAGAQGTDGQVLTSTGSGIAWEDVAGGPTFKTFGTSSIMIGDDATGTISGANYNTGVGDGVFAALTEGDENVMVGFAAGQSLTTGSYNIGIGVNAVDDCNTGNYNVGIGTAALGASTSGYFQTAIGHEALKNTNYTTNVYAYNTAVGYQAGVANTTGKITAIGAMVLASNTTGIMNVGVGGATDATGAALQANTTGNYNTAVGASSLRNNTEGYQNTALGYTALTSNLTGIQNTAIGANALYANTTGNYNAAVGIDCLKSVTTGNQNVGIGYRAGDSITTGSENIAIGSNALQTLTASLYPNIAIGTNALYSMVNGYQNIAIGYRAGESLTGIGNTFMGDSAGLSATNSNGNTFYGYVTGYSTTSGASNVAIGSTALFANTTASNNTAVGKDAGSQTSTGSYNTWVGANCMSTSAWGGASRVGANGFGAGLDVRSNYRVQIGYYTDYIYADYQSSATWNRISDERKKKNIENLEVGLDYINALRPVTYKWKAPSELPSNLEGYDPDNTTPPSLNKQVGLIAQEVKAVNDAHSLDFNLAWDKPDGFGNENEDGLQALSYENLIMPLIKAIQELSAKVEELESQIGN